MDFALMDSDDLLAVIPADEDDKWELKSADILTKKGELKKELGKQVSAFANSGGGYLVFGIGDGTKQIEECEQVVGRQSMKDYLATMTEQCVEQPIRDFRVHRVPFADNSDKSVFVIEVGDSPAAPHQAKDERQYYYRIDGHSKPAPHFHLELLRSRMTKTVLEVSDEVDYSLSQVRFEGSTPFMKVTFHIPVKNTSMTTATSWGLHLRTHSDCYVWSESNSSRYLTEGLCVHGEELALLPDEQAVVKVGFEASEPTQYALTIVRRCEILWEKFGLFIRPVSQNFIGQEVFYGWRDAARWIQAKNRLGQELEQWLKQ